MSEDLHVDSDAKDKRAASLTALPQEAAVPRKVWAFLVGISKYQKKPELELLYARKDAQDLHRCLTQPEYGEIPEHQVKTLYDPEATLAVIVSELRAFLKLPGKEDVVILFFSCHGAIDRVDEGREVPYLLPYDVDPDNLAGTALPMREVHASIKDYLAAKRIIILSDACYSGGIITTAERPKSADTSQEEEASRRRYLQEIKSTYEVAMSRSKAGVAMLSSSRDNEVSKEFTSLENGIFTHYLLRGLRGEADGAMSQGWQDNIVTLGELFKYVSQSVAKKTNDKQRPVQSIWSFDENLPVAVVGGLAARSRLALAEALLTLAQDRGDPMRFLAAVRQYELAQKKGHHDSKLCEAAELGRMKALALTRWARVEPELMRPLTSQSPQVAGEVELYRAHWLLSQARLADAVRALDHFTRFYPSHPLAPLVKAGLPELAEQASHRPRGHALLIAVSDLPGVERARRRLRGPSNDVRILWESLVRSGRFASEDITVLIDERATSTTVLTALERLRSHARPGDVVFVHFSGQEPLCDTSGLGRLLTYDVSWEPSSKKIEGGLPLFDAHAVLEEIPCATKILSLDVCNQRGLSALIEPYVVASSYRLWLAASPNQSAQEKPFKRAGESADEILESSDSWDSVDSVSNVYGLYSHELARQLQQIPLEPSTLGAFWDGLAERVTSLNPRQRPREQIGERRPRPQQKGVEALLSLTLQHQYSLIEPERLAELARTLTTTSDHVPDSVFLSLTLALIEHRQWRNAAQLLDRCQCASEAERAFIVTHALAAGELDLAAQALRAFPEASLNREFQCLQASLERLDQVPRTALIVSAQRTDPSRTPDRSLPCSWTHQLGRHLRRRFLFRCTVVEEDDFRVRGQQLLSQAAEVATGSLVVILLGNGLPEPAFGLVGADGQPVVGIAEILATLSKARRQTMLLIDRNTIGLAPRHREVGLGESIGDLNQLRQALTGLARTTWVIGVDAVALAELLASQDEDRLTFEVLRKHPSFTVMWPPNDSPEAARFGPVIDTDAQIGGLLERLELMQKESARNVQLRGQSVTGSSDKDPELQLNLAVVDLELGRRDSALSKLKQIVGLSLSDVHPDVRAEANLLLGQILTERGDDLDRAVIYFRDARDGCPDWPHAHYYLAQALRAQAERRIQHDVVAEYRQYLRSGAPLGFRREVEEFLIEQSGKSHI